MDPLNKEQRRKNMQANKPAGTKSEILLAKALWKKGWRYKKNDSSILGKPDIVITKYKIAIFCDGEFWHGKDWDIKKQRINANKNYWVKKIEGNMERDKAVNEYLTKNGWIVKRFWHKEIQKNIESCVLIIERLIWEKNQKDV